MPVIFDEVIGSVDEEAEKPPLASQTSYGDAPPSPEKEHEIPMLRARMRQIRERAERLRAD